LGKKLRKKNEKKILQKLLKKIQLIMSVMKFNNHFTREIK